MNKKKFIPEEKN